jgi:protein-disulfide isomerase
MKFAFFLAMASAFAEDTALIEGAPQSAVRVIVYEDLQCPDCANFRRMMDEQLLPRFAARVAFEHRDFPLAKHSWARPASIAARYFQDRRSELGLEFRRFILATLRQTTAATFRDRVSQFARDKGLDAERAVAALDDPRLAALVEKDFQEGVARGVAKTPTVFVNGQPFIERFALEEISKAIETALSELKR